MKRVSSKVFFMQKTRRKRCPECGFLSTQKWGKRNGHQRYKCSNCGVIFTSRRKDVSQQNRFVWFEWWILRKQTIIEISQMSGCSERTLRRWFDDYLKSYPQWEIQRREKVNLLIDGTWFPNKLCLVLFRDENIKTTLFYRLTDNEWEDEIYEDLVNIQNLGIEIESVTSDGGRNIIKSVKRACPQAKRQRCLAHIQRECLTWLTRHPKSDAGKDLRNLVCMIHKIETHNDSLYWKSLFKQWCDTYQDYLNTRSYKPETNTQWYTHKMVRKAYVHIRRAMPDMFHYTENNSIPKTTNALESFFGHLKENISLHRGLSYNHYQNYVKWYLYFRNKSNKNKRF